MAYYRQTIRMGMLNLLLLVIALSLAVLGVLSVVTAQASENLSNKQANSIHEAYAEEMAGQYFLSSLDSMLESARGTNFDGMSYMAVLTDSIQTFAQNAVDVAGIDGEEIKYDVGVLSVDEIMYELGAATDPDAVTQEFISEDVVLATDAGDSVEATSPNIVTLEQIDGVSDGADSNAAEYATSLSTLLETCIGGVRAEYITADGRDLVCIIAINDDATYEILRWKSTKIWDLSSQEETLWLG